MHLYPGVSRVEVKNIDEDYRSALPEDYWRFLLFSNGCSGFIGGSYLILWKMEELIRDNEGYRVEEFAPDFILIGSNGGGMTFGFDKNTKNFVEMPFDVMGQREYIIQVSGSFDAFLKYLYDRDDTYTY